MSSPSSNSAKVVIRFTTRFHRASGVTVEKHDPPLDRFFIDYVDADGGICHAVWEGEDYLAACAAAREWELPIEDTVSKGGHN